MNPLTQVRNLQKITDRETAAGVSDDGSWHAKYKGSAYIFAGGLPFDLTEGDVLAAFAQYGEIVDLNLVRDNCTGKSKGFAFLAYEDQRSTVLAVDNLNGSKLLGRTIRVDHVLDYKRKLEEDEEEEQKRREERGVCYAFQRGECTRGSSCKFSHDEQRNANTGWGPKFEEPNRKLERGPATDGSKWGRGADGLKWVHDRYEDPKPLDGARLKDGDRKSRFDEGRTKDIEDRRSRFGMPSASDDRRSKYEERRRRGFEDGSRMGDDKRSRGPDGWRSRIDEGRSRFEDEGKFGEDRRPKSVDNGRSRFYEDVQDGAGRRSRGYDNGKFRSEELRTGHHVHPGRGGRGGFSDAGYMGERPKYESERSKRVDGDRSPLGGERTEFERRAKSDERGHGSRARVDDFDLQSGAERKHGPEREQFERRRWEVDKARVEERKSKFHDEERPRSEGDRGRFYERKSKFHDEERPWSEGDKGRVHERKSKFHDALDVDMSRPDENSVNTGTKVHAAKELSRE